MTERKHTRCRFCSLGCGCLVETVFGQPVGIEYDRDDRIGGGALCAKGNYMLELLDHPKRLTEARWEGSLAARDEIMARIAAALAGGTGERTGLILDGLASAEDIGRARAFAEQCAPGCRFGVHVPTGEDRASAALGEMLYSGRHASLYDIAASACTIAVGDPFAAGPVIAGRVLDARYRKRGNLFAAIAESENMTTRLSNAPVIGPVRAQLAEFLGAVCDHAKGGDSWIAGVRKLNRPQTGDKIAMAARMFVETPSAVLLLQTGDPVAAQLAAMAVLAAGDDKRLLYLTEYANAAEAGNLHGTMTVDSILDAAASGGIDTLIVLGADALGGADENQRNAIAGSVGLIAAGSPFESVITRQAHAVMPTAIWCEYPGTYDGEMQQAAVDPPGGALPYGDILTGIASAMNLRLNPLETPEGKRAIKIDSDHALRILEEAKSEAPQRIMTPSAVSFGDGFLTGRTRWARVFSEVQA